jgi:hypothetical protein
MVVSVPTTMALVTLRTGLPRFSWRPQLTKDCTPEIQLNTVWSFVLRLISTLNATFLEPDHFAALSASSRIPALKQPSWEAGTLCHEILLGVHPFNQFPAPGLNEAAYSAPDVAALTVASGNPVLTQVIVGLLRWDPAQRLSLDEAVHTLLSANHCSGCAVLNYF